MGLASKLQAAQAGGNPYGAPMMGSAPGPALGAASPSAPPLPAGPGGGPYAPPQAAAGSYPAAYPQQQMQMGQPGPPQGPYGAAPAGGVRPSPYPPGAPVPQPAAGAAPPYGAAGAGAAAPYGAAGAAPPYGAAGAGAAAPYGAAGAAPPYGAAGAAAAPYPGVAPTSQPFMQQQQQPQQGMPAGYPGQPPMQQQQQQQQLYAPGQPGMAPSAAGAAGGAAMGSYSTGHGGMVGAILSKLQSCVSTNQLDRFYSPASLQALAARLDGRVNFRELAARWQMPVELALDLAALSLYDTVLFADDSGSMAFEENGERIDDLKIIAQKVAEVATLFDDDGILVRFMNSNTQGNAIRSPADVGSLLSQVQYAGLTPLATSLQSKVLQPIVFTLAASGQLAKPVLIITITDGEPTDNPKDLVVQVIKDARTRLSNQYGPKAVAFEFCQVGKDQRAQAFLARLDTDPQVGNSIDCTSYFEMESAEYQRRGINLSPSMWLVKMMCGAIDPSYDEADE